LHHQFGWRDLFDVVVRWRQISEPNDPVWWIDRFPSRAFEEGFGLQTPIVNGQLKTIRYYPYFAATFDLVKNLLRDGYWTASDSLQQVSTDKLQAIERTTSLDALYAIVGEDFYVIVPTPSMLDDSTAVLEGTRLTLVRSVGGSSGAEDEYVAPGFEFTIRTPGKPYRWTLFEMELDACFSRLEDTLLAVPPTVDFDPSVEDHLLSRALQLFYWWVTFAPLSRGTAACGYAFLQAVLVSCGRKIDKKIPKGKQLDWEAILARDCMQFVSKVKPWFEPLVPCDLLSSTDSEGDDPDVIKFSCTMKDMIELLMLPYPKAS